MDIKTLMEAITQDAIQHGHDVQWNNGDDGVLSVAIYMDGVDVVKYEVVDTVAMLERLVKANADHETIVDAFWWLMNEYYQV